MLFDCESLCSVDNSPASGAGSRRCRRIRNERMGLNRVTKSEQCTDQMSVRICRLTLAAIGFVTFAAGSACGDYAVQRVVAGLNQPTFVTQAPGDNSSLYI